MSEIGPDLEAEARPSKWSKLKEKVGGSSKKAARIALLAARVALGPGDEGAAAVLSALPTPAHQSDDGTVIKEALPPNQWKVVPKEEKQVAASGGDGKDEQYLNREVRRGHKVQRVPNYVSTSAVKTGVSVPNHPNRLQTAPLRR